MRSALSEIGRGAAVSQIDLDTFFFVGLLVTRVRQEWILEEVLVDVVDDDARYVQITSVCAVCCAMRCVQLSWIPFTPRYGATVVATRSPI